MPLFDGSNKWIPGAKEFLADPQQLTRDPYGTVAGAADAAALNFDEAHGTASRQFGGWGTANAVDTYNKIRAGDTSGAGNDTSGSEPPASEGDYSEYANDPRRDARNWVPKEVREELNKIDAPEGFWTSAEAFEWVNQQTNLPDVSANMSYGYGQDYELADTADDTPTRDDTSQSGGRDQTPDPEDGTPTQPQPPMQGGGGALGTVALAGGGLLAAYIIYKVVL